MAPIIFSRKEAGLVPAAGTYKYGNLGRIKYVTFHHTDGPRATSQAKARELNRADQQLHIAPPRNWGDIAYHFLMDDAGRLYHGRPIDAKGSHVALNNSNNIGIVLHGNYDTDELTSKQKDSLRWLFRGGFYSLLDVHEKDLTVKVHGEWLATDCPGKHLHTHIDFLRNTEMK